MRGLSGCIKRAILWILYLIFYSGVLLQTKSNLPFTSAIQYHPGSTRRILKSRGKPVSVSI